MKLGTLVPQGLVWTLQVTPTAWEEIAAASPLLRSPGAGLCQAPPGRLSPAARCGMVGDAEPQTELRQPEVSGYA